MQMHPNQGLLGLRKAEIIATRRGARHIVYGFSNDKVRRILNVSIANLVRSSKKAILLRLNSNNRLATLLKFAYIFKRFLIVLFFMTITHNAAADSRLIMVTSDYCPYCQSWERDVGAVYKKSPYAAKLPLSRVKFGSKMPNNVAIKKPVVGTPTFLIIRNGQEVDRQRGYTDAEMFFWWISDHTIE